MGQVNIRKRGKVYQYQFETARINGKRTQILKSGFRTKAEALLAGQKAQAEYINGGNIIKENRMTYSAYLDYWYEDYCKSNYKYSTYKRYYSAFKYLKKELGKYKISFITGYQLNQFLLNMYIQNHSANSIKNFKKVIKVH